MEFAIFELKPIFIIKRNHVLRVLMQFMIYKEWFNLLIQYRTPTSISFLANLFKSSLNSHIFDTLGHTVIYIVYTCRRFSTPHTHARTPFPPSCSTNFFFVFVLLPFEPFASTRHCYATKRTQYIHIWWNSARIWNLRISRTRHTSHIYITKRSCVLWFLSWQSKDKKMYNSPSKGRNCATRLYYTLCCNPSSSGSLKNVDHTSSTFCSLSLVVVVPDIWMCAHTFSL